MRARIVACAVLALSFGAASRADEAGNVRAAVDDLYARLADADAPGLARYLPSGGFTEFSPPESTLKTLDLAYFRQALEAGARIHLRVDHQQVRLRGSAAIVTGYRVGAITLPDGRRLDVRDCMTMLWGRERHAWKLQHVHISPCSGEVAKLAP